MKLIIKISVLFAFVTASLSSCNNDGYSLGDFMVSWGTIQVPEGSSSYILRDDGAKLHILNNLVPHQSISDGQRVIANYTILGEIENAPSKAYNVKLNNLYLVLTKEPVAQSFIDEHYDHRTDSLGVDNIKVKGASFGWNYLNIEYKVAYASPGIAHMINLVHDDNPDPLRGDSIFLYMRHNKMDDSEVYWGENLVSFKISDLVPDGKTSVPVKLIWADYDGKTYSDSGTFTLREASPLAGAVNTTANDIMVKVK